MRVQGWGVFGLGLALIVSSGPRVEGQGVPVDVHRLGPQVGDTIPDFSAVDQDGRTQTLNSILGPKGAMVVFNRSADWWPYCRTQLVELQSRYDDLRTRGLGLAAFTYDPPEVIRAFAAARHITFPLLSDADHAVVTRYGILNEEYEPGHKNYGIPHPGTFLVDARGRVTARFFEQNYRIRNTVASIATKVAAPAGATRPAIKLTTDHLEIVTWVSDEAVAPGNRFSLVLDVVPRPGVHVYAPGRHAYRVIAVTLEPNPAIELQPLAYPESEIYHFVPLDERVEVYQKPFRLVQDVVVPVTAETRKLAQAPDASLTIAGTIAYQACDDKVCFPPVDLPAAWTLGLKPLQ